MEETYSWLLSGDPSIIYLTRRDLLGVDDELAKSRIGSNGWCAEYAKHRNSDGGWGRSFYQPKWISTHYTLLELRNLEYDCSDQTIKDEIERIGIHELSNKTVGKRFVIGSDVCVCGMFLNYAGYFRVDEQILGNTVDFILSQRMDDGGYNCDRIRYEVNHSSLHSTLSVLEGFMSYTRSGYLYRKDEIEQSALDCVDFILAHKLFRSSTTNEVIDQKFLRMTYPFRWKYTVLRALNCFVDMKIPYDSRMDDGINHIKKKQNRSGSWNLQSKFSGLEYFSMEEVGKPSRVITYFTMKILKYYESDL